MTMDIEPPTDFLQGLNRIRCNGSRIMVGSRDFTSASEALEAYLDQYAGNKAVTMVSGVGASSQTTDY
jgi:predicted Rossmann fold nucleotide-binding protein DprA/Smf involved in DNA uptake